MVSCCKAIVHDLCRAVSAMAMRALQHFRDRGEKSAMAAEAAAAGSHVQVKRSATLIEPVCCSLPSLSSPRRRLDVMRRRLCFLGQALCSSFSKCCWR